MPTYNAAGAAGATELNIDAAERERYGISAAQSISGNASKSSPDGGLFDALGFDEIEVSAIITAKSGTPTSVTVYALESDTNEAAGQTVVPGAQVAFTGSDLAVAVARSFRVRWVGRKRYLGLKVEVDGGVSVGVALLARGAAARDTADARAPSTVLAGSVLA